jgi:hypothetical protein
MFSHERMGAVVNKGGNHAVRGVEASMVQRFLIKELLSFLKFHDPTIFEFSPESHKDMYLPPNPDQRSLRRVVQSQFSDEDAILLQELYNQMDLDRKMMEAVDTARAAGENVMRDIVRDRWVDVAKCLDTCKRCYKTLSDVRSYAPWEKADSVVVYVSPDCSSIHYGIVVGIYRHRPFAHTLSPSFELFKVRSLEWETGEYLDRVKIPGDIYEARGHRFILFDQVLPVTACLMPAQASDVTLGFSHNVIQFV